MKVTELSEGPFGRNKNYKLLALKCLMYVGEVVLLLFFEVLLEKRLTLSYVPNFQGHTMHCVEMVAV